jgi:hypothetical protein
MTMVRIAHVEPWPGRRGLRGHGFRVFSFLVVLADDTGGRALPVWLNGPEGHGLFRGDGGHPHPEPAEAITAELLRAAGVAVTGVHIELRVHLHPGLHLDIVQSRLAEQLRYPPPDPGIGAVAAERRREDVAEPVGERGHQLVVHRG